MKDAQAQAQKNQKVEEMENLKAELEEKKIAKLTPEQMKVHQDEVRNEGLKVLAEKRKSPSTQDEVSLEIEAPGAAQKIVDEGAKIISHADYISLQSTLKAARAKPENKLGKGGFQIPLTDPATFENTLKVVQMESIETPQS